MNATSRPGIAHSSGEVFPAVISRVSVIHIVHLHVFSSVLSCP
jgi:hypothetical protein